jgi:hypothetical protein
MLTVIEFLAPTVNDYERVASADDKTYFENDGSECM